MRISAVAGAAGVSTRTVRFYHQLGVLPEPARAANGYRDYSFEDLARLLRLRWLADSGLPLAVAGPGVEHRGHDLIEDIDQALEHLGTRVDELSRQQQLLTDLRANLLAGQRLSPLPAFLNRRFEELLADLESPAREVLLKEREVLETLALTGGGDAEFYARYDRVLSSPEAATVMLPLLARFGALHGADPDRQAGEIAALASEIAQQSAVADLLQYAVTDLLQYAVTDLPADAFTEGGGSGSEDGPSAEEILPDPAQRAVVAEVVRLVWP